MAKPLNNKMLLTLALTVQIPDNMACMLSYYSFTYRMLVL